MSSHDLWGYSGLCCSNVIHYSSVLFLSSSDSSRRHCLHGRSLWQGEQEEKQGIEMGTRNGRGTLSGASLESLHRLYSEHSVMCNNKYVYKAKRLCEVQQDKR